jgi:hypothetical protein
MTAFGVFCIVIGLVLKAYASTIAVRDSTLSAMGASATRKAASIVGTILLVLGAMAVLPAMLPT